MDEAIRRRLHLIPFSVTIPKTERDPDLPEKLKAEWPGILRANAKKLKHDAEQVRQDKQDDQ